MKFTLLLTITALFVSVIYADEKQLQCGLTKDACEQGIKALKKMDPKADYKCQKQDGSDTYCSTFDF
jgi:hypothetical protein